MKLYFARHGESEANVQQVFWNQPGRYGLTDKGREQAQALAEVLGDTGFVALYSSPVLRAVQTAEIVAQRLHLTYKIEGGLRECNVGIYEGQTYSEAAVDLQRQVRAQWMEQDNRDARIEGGESYNDIKARFMPIVKRLEEEHRGTEANVLLISHGGALRSMLPLLLSNVDNAASMARSIGYTAYIVAEVRGSEWVCQQWGEEGFEMGDS